MRHAYLGPAFGDAAIEAAVARRADKVASTRVSDIVSTTADLLAAGHPVAWFQGRMEFGPRALGNRSILGCPSVPGVADRINAQIKFRERWRPFCPSILDRVAREKLLARTQEDIQREKEKALAELNNAAIDLSFRIAQRVMKEDLDKDRHDRLVSSFISDMRELN